MKAPLASGLLAAGLLAFSLVQSFAATPTPEELSEAHRWAAAKFQGVTEHPRPAVGLFVLANNDPVQRNARNGAPMKIAERSFSRGLYCHAFSKISVRLPAPGSTFSAIVGVDSNEQTSGGRGSVDFSVTVGKTERFRSGLLREGMPGKPVHVSLDGATEFTLQIAETVEGITCDQADWADAKVQLADGRSIWLADLPLIQNDAPSLPTTDPFFSFTYNGKPSSELLPQWKLHRTQPQTSSGKISQTLTWTDPHTSLQVRCVAVSYSDFPTLEWTLYFKNTGSNDSPILADIQALDTRLQRPSSCEFLLHHHVGSPCQVNDYQPLTTTLKPNQTERFAPPAGRPTDSVLPYFSIDLQAEGVIAVVGWPGQWSAQFTRDAANGLRLTAGQERTHLILHPGEEIRSPLVVLQFWKGDWIHAQNVWRRWMLEHNLPRPGGKPLAPQMAACSSHQFGEMIHANEENQKLFIARYLEEKLPLDYWWMDAGWYYCQTKYHQWAWPQTGTWEVDTNRFPNGLRAITDYAHARQVKSIVWFEPERVAPETWLYQKHPDWLLGQDGEKLLNLGNPQAREWLVKHFDHLIRTQGIDLYRQDFNCNPLDRWRANDATNRQGITEIRHVEGYLAFWDELRRRHPGMLIDSCASGGRRNDLETLRRAVPLLRSDYILEPVGQQCHTYGIALWIPFYGTGSSAMDPYHFRSQMCPHFTACYDMRRSDLPFPEARRLVSQWKNQVAPCFFGDFYPLTTYQTNQDVWMAWQFHRPENSDGLVQVFRRADSCYEAARFKLNALDETAVYLLTDLDAPQNPRRITGRELLEKGVLATIPEKPGAIVLTYKKLQSP